MTPTTRTRLLNALDSQDWNAVNALGWQPIIEALRWWGVPKLDTSALKTYADLHGDRDPNDVHAALRTAADIGGRFRPSPAELSSHISPAASNHASTRRQAHNAAALARVAIELAHGTDTCDCRPRPANVTIDDAGVLRCPNCHGIEPGQADQALEAPQEQAA